MPSCMHATSETGISQGMAGMVTQAAGPKAQLQPRTVKRALSRYGPQATLVSWKVGPVASELRNAPRRYDMPVRHVIPPRPVPSLSQTSPVGSVEMNLKARVRALRFPTTPPRGPRRTVTPLFPPEGEQGVPLQSAER